MPTPDWRTIDRYLTGQASVAERAEVHAWLAANPRHSALLETLRKPPAAFQPAVDVDSAWARFDRHRPTGKPARVNPFERRPLTRVWQFAAAAMLVLAAGTVWQVAHMRRGASAAGGQPREIVASAGVRTAVTLSDGTRVTLNGGSRLTLAKDYGDRARDVDLDGEGYFEVTHDAEHPFRVHARNATAEDLGTRFTVRAYASQPLAVAVAEGAVSLRRDSSAADAVVRLAAGDLGILNATGPIEVSHGVQPDRYVAWALGSFVLDSVPLSEAAIELERWYGIHVVITDSALARRTVLARFHAETAEQALEAIAFALGARSERSRSTYTLRPLRP